MDPKIEPSKLFMVQRIKKLKGEPKWVKEIIEKLKLDTDVSIKAWYKLKIFSLDPISPAVLMVTAHEYFSYFTSPELLWQPRQ